MSHAVPKKHSNNWRQPAAAAKREATNPRAEWGYWLGIVALAATARCAVAFGPLRAMPLLSDAASYSRDAINLIAGVPRTEAYYWPPGTSFALAAAYRLFGTGIVVASTETIAISVLCVVLTALLARRLLGPGPAARAAGWLAACYVPAVLASGQPYSHPLAALCLLAVAYFGMVAIERPVLFPVAALAFALGCLTRPSMASVLPVMLLYWILRRRLVGAALAVLVTAAVISPVLAYNHARGAGWTISTNNEENFFLGNNPYTPNYKTSHLGQRSLNQLPPETREYLRRFSGRNDSRAAMRDEAIRFVVHHPGITVYRTFNRILSFWGFDYGASRLVQVSLGWSNLAMLPLLALEAGAYLAVMTLALVGLAGFRRELDGAWMRWLFALIIAYQFPYWLSFSSGAYHFVVMGLVIPFACMAAARLRSAIGRAELFTLLRRSRRLHLALVIFAMVQLEYAYYSILMK